MRKFDMSEVYTPFDIFMILAICLIGVGFMWEGNFLLGPVFILYGVYVALSFEYRARLMEARLHEFRAWITAELANKDSSLMKAFR